MLRSKIENANWAEKTTTTRCGIRETSITRNVVLWLFSNNHMLWHLKVCHDAKVVSWLLKGMLRSKIKNTQWAEKITTTRCGIRGTATTRNSEFQLHENTTRCRGRFPFYSHDMMWDKFQPAEVSVSISLFSLASDRATSWCFVQPCLLIAWRRFLMTKWRSWMTQAVIWACFLMTSITITFYTKLRKLRYCERITSHRLWNIRCHEDRWYRETYWKWFRRKWWFKHSLILQDGGAVWCLGNSTYIGHKRTRGKRQSCLWFTKTFSLSFPFYIFVSFFQSWKLNWKRSIATLLDKW